MSHRAKELLLEMLLLRARYSDMEFDRVSEALKDGGEGDLARLAEIIRKLEGSSARGKKRKETARVPAAADPLLQNVMKLVGSKDTFKTVKRSFRLSSRGRYRPRRPGKIRRRT